MLFMQVLFFYFDGVEPDVGLLQLAGHKNDIQIVRNNAREMMMMT
jgi:hypothetical protein